MRPVLVITGAAAGLLLLLSFNYFEPLHLEARSAYERSASSFSAGAALGAVADPADSAGPAPAAPSDPDARMAELEGAMRRAATLEDFDQAKRLKQRLDVLRAARVARLAAAQQAAAPTAGPREIAQQAAAPARPAAPRSALLPILTARPQDAPPAERPSERRVGCLVSAWNSAWLVHPNGTRSFLPEAPATCVARATAADVAQIAKNDGPGALYEFKGPALTALACSSEPCAPGPVRPSGSGSGAELSGADAACVLGALRATPAAPYVPAEGDGGEGEGGSALTRELVARYASPQRQIIVTFVNLHYLPFAVTWVHHLRAVGCNHFLVGAMDEKALAELRLRRIQAFSIASGGVASRDLGWGSAAFKVAQQVKVQMFADLLALGFDALLADIDAVFLRDPLPYLACLPEADVLVSSDHLHNSTTDGGLELPTSAHATMNVGILYSRARPGPLAFMREWARRCSANLDFWEQAIFNEMAKQKPGLDTSNSTLAPRRLFAFWGRRLVGGILPVSLFCSGHTGFVQKMHAKLGFNAPYALHATFQYSGTRGKIERFREAGAWVDSAAYYAPQGGLLRFQPALPPELTRAPWVGVADTERHLALVATQMAAVRDAWALAQALGRTLLMPRLVCGYDRYWAGMPEGKIPGSALSLPIEACPMDHLFELERWPQPEAAFREWSLLDNERTPESVKASVSVASLAALPAGRALSAALLDAGANLSASVLDMQAVPHYTEVLTEPAQRREFELTIRRTPAAFCCNPRGAPPIAYAMPLGTPSDRVGPLPKAPAPRRLSMIDWSGLGDRPHYD